MPNKLVHFIASLLAFGLPILFATHSPVLNLTIGGLLNAIYLTASQLLNPTAKTNSII